MEDSRIVELFWRRDERAIEETRKKYEKYCYVIAHNILGIREDAEETVNDAYAGAWNAMPPHRPDSLSAFLGKITRRLSLKKLREKNAAKRGEGQIPAALDELEECIPDSCTAEERGNVLELAEILNDFLAGLPVDQRRVFVCRYWYFDSIRDIASRFGFTQSKVKMMLKRTREKLSERLKKEEVYI